MTGEVNAAAAASFVSIILSLSSVIFGQLLDKRLDTLSEASTYDVVSYCQSFASARLKNGFFNTGFLFCHLVEPQKRLIEACSDV